MQGRPALTPNRDCPSAHGPTGPLAHQPAGREHLLLSQPTTPTPPSPPASAQQHPQLLPTPVSASGAWRSSTETPSDTAKPSLTSPSNGSSGGGGGDMPRERRRVNPRADDAAVEEEVDERTAFAGAGAGAPSSYQGTASALPTEGGTTGPRAREEQTSCELEEHTGFLGKLGSIELENKGSVARDHLALERTFLAWLRTSLAFASIGIAVTQLFRLNTSMKESSTVKLRSVGKPLGATFLALAIVVLIIGVNRYYESQAWLLKGKFPASRGSVLLLTVIACALIVTSLVIILAISPSTFEA